MSQRSLTSPFLLTHLQVLLKQAFTFNQFIVFLPPFGLLADLPPSHLGQLPFLVPSLQLAAGKETGGFGLAVPPQLGKCHSITGTPLTNPPRLSAVSQEGNSRNKELLDVADHLLPNHDDEQLLGQFDEAPARTALQDETGGGGEHACTCGICKSSLYTGSLSSDRAPKENACAWRGSAQFFEKWPSLHKDSLRHYTYVFIPHAQELSVLARVAHKPAGKKGRY